MDGPRRWIRRLRLLLRRQTVEQTMDSEIRDHIAREIAGHIQRGLSREAARQQALADFGGIESVKEAGRDERGLRLVEDLAADLRHGLRIAARTPGVTSAIVVTFALGIAVATSI